MPHAIVDFDSVLSQTQEILLRLCNRKFKTDYKIADLTMWRSEEILPADYSRFMWESVFMDPIVQLFCPMVSRSKSGIFRIMRNGYDVSIVSDRPQVLYETTRTWLDFFGLKKFELIFTSHEESMSHPRPGITQTKQDVALQKGTTIVVEDSPHHSLDFAAMPQIETVYLLDYPWNQHVEHEKIKRVDSWNHILPS